MIPLPGKCPQVSLQLEHKFGKEFAQQARSNMSGTVNPKVSSSVNLTLINNIIVHIIILFWRSQVIHRLGAEAPKKSLVENYMIEIARNYKVDYDPDPSMFLVGFIALLSPNDFCLYIPWLVVSLQEDDVLPSEPSVAAKPFLPDDEPRGGGGGGGGGGGAGPLPQKEEPRYIHTPQSQQPPSASNQVHNYYVLCEYCTVC